MEIWKDVPEMNGVKASSEGRILLPPAKATMPNGNQRSYKTKPRLGTVSRSKGRSHMRRIINYRGKSFKVHQLVCLAFHGPKPFPNAVVIHIDEDGLNNKPDNLRWGTQKENLNMPKVKAFHSMSPAKVLRFSDAHYAIGKAPSTLRNWLARGQIKLPGEHSEGWREFSWADIATLAVVSRLVDFGVRVEAASSVTEFLQKEFPDVFGLKLNRPDSMLLFWGNRVVRVWPEGDRLRVSAVELINQTRDKTLKSTGERVDAFILLDVSTILSVVFARASESNSDGATT